MLYTKSTSELGYIKSTSKRIYIKGAYNRIYIRNRNKIIYIEFASYYCLVLLIAEDRLIYTPLKISVG
jgi:hypothetical protein